MLLMSSPLPSFAHWISFQYKIAKKTSLLTISTCLDPGEQLKTVANVVIDKGQSQERERQTMKCRQCNGIQL